MADTFAQCMTLKQRSVPLILILSLFGDFLFHLNPLCHFACYICLVLALFFSNICWMWVHVAATDSEAFLHD